MKLNKTYGLLAGAMVASALLFAGCKAGAAQPPAPPTPVPVVKEAPKAPMPADAQGLLKYAAENSLSAKSVSSEILMDIEMMGMKMNLTFDIEKCDNLTYTSGEFMGMRFEAYSDGKNMAMMEPMTKRWARVPPEQKDMMTSLEQVQRKIYGEHLKDAAFAGQDKIQDKACRIIGASVNPEAFNNLLAGQNNPMMAGLDVKFNSASLKIWVENDTGLICKSILIMEATMTGDIPGMPGGIEGGKLDIEDEEAADSKPPTTKPEELKPEAPKMTKIKYEIEVNNSDYNKVAPIVIPLEVKALLETPVVEPANK
ncbi:MAG: hypothetical protein HZA49_02970 [Planctomycetes bacterium]|nr:hypothetical protein [Planctomycetota bacterium]